MNTDTGEIRPWDSLTDEEKASGKWVQVSGDFARLVQANTDVLESSERVKAEFEVRERMLREQLAKSPSFSDRLDLVLGQRGERQPRDTKGAV
jgi:hypothetical protein